MVVGSKKSDKPEIYLNAMRIGSKRVDLEKEMEPEERKAILKVIFRDVGFRSSGCGVSDFRIVGCRNREFEDEGLRVATQLQLQRWMRTP